MGTERAEWGHTTFHELVVVETMVLLTRQGILGRSLSPLNRTNSSIDHIFGSFSPCSTNTESEMGEERGHEPMTTPTLWNFPKGLAIDT
jgi:hypothetical protein